MAPDDPAHLDDVALAFPELVIVAHHIGDPWTDMAVRLAARHANFYLCTSVWSPFVGLPYTKVTRPFWPKVADPFVAD